MVVSLGALAFALTMQYGFGVVPCQLCMWQRAPFVGAAFFALIASVARPYGNHTRWLLGLCALLFFANTGLAIFHSGVERHWWEFHSSCTGSVLDHLSVEALRQQLLGTPVVRCDEISWTLLGLSMANWNIFFSLALALFASKVASTKAA